MIRRVYHGAAFILAADMAMPTERSTASRHITGRGVTCDRHLWNCWRLVAALLGRVLEISCSL